MKSIGGLWGQSVVVFSQNYLPLSRVNLRRAVVLLVAGKAEPLHTIGGGTGWIVRSPGLVLQVPAHIRLVGTGIERFWKVPPVNRREVFRRDRHTCQYCGSQKTLTIDHVLPKSKGGAHAWENVVTACEPCNSRKGDRTPEEAHMPLLRHPKAPLHPVMAFAEEFWRDRSEN